MSGRPLGPTRRALLACGALGAASVGAAPRSALTVAVFPLLDEIVKAALVLWQQRYPGVEIDIVSRQYGDHHTAMTTALSTSGLLPDVMALEASYVGRFAPGGGLEDLAREPYRIDRFRARLVPYAYNQAVTRAGAMRHRSAGLAALLLAACAAVPPSPPPAGAEGAPPRLDVPAGYALVWSDEFAGDGLPDPGRWAYDTGMNKAGWHNRELQYYSPARAENAELHGGRLVIHARKESMSHAADWGGQRYTSSRLLTKGKAEWTYGFFEIRAKLPCGKGSWPAIWMLNSALDWPNGGELDIMEHVGREPGRVFSTVHTAAAHGTGKGDATQVPDACTAFHDYQMHWTPQALRFGIDGKVHFVYPNPGTGRDQWPFDTPQFLILNIAVGGDFAGAVDDSIFPVRMEIDHVRVYQKAKWRHRDRAPVAPANVDRQAPGLRCRRQTQRGRSDPPAPSADLKLVASPFGIASR